MEKNSNQIVIGLLVLIIGFGAGYVARGSQTPEAGEHMMSNGSVMENTGTSTGMEQAMTGMTDGLSGKTGDAFDKAFLSEMIVHHQGAVEMANAALANAKHQEIKDMARAIITAQTSEIAQMQAWGKSWYNQ